MRYANTKTEHHICADQAVRGEAYLCPVCGGDLNLHKGQVITAYFAHKRNCPCLDHWTYTDSPWKARMLALFKPENQEVVVIHDAQRHRADALLDDTVLLFTEGDITKKTFQERTAFFRNAGKDVVWVMNAHEQWAKNEIRRNRKDRSKFFWDAPYPFLTDLLPQQEKHLFIILQLTEQILVKIEWSAPDFTVLIADAEFTPAINTVAGIRQIKMNQYARFDDFKQQNMPWRKKSSSTIDAQQKEWYLCEKTGHWHNDDCKHCPHNLINEYRSGNKVTKGGLFFYCCYPRVITPQPPDAQGTIKVKSIWLK